MTMLPKPAADEADWLADRILDEIDKEPEPLRRRLLAAIREDRHHVYRQPDGTSVVTFDDDSTQYVVTRLPSRRSDA